MCKWYKEMDCYVLVSPNRNRRFNIDKIAERAELESSFRNYAAVFDKVKIVIHDTDTKEHFLNFPHLSHSKKTDSSQQLSSILQDATSDAVFVGHTNKEEFPLTAITNLIKSYNGEMFLGYHTEQKLNHNLQFGIYNSKLLTKPADTLALEAINKKHKRLLPLPDSLAFLF